MRPTDVPQLPAGVGQTLEAEGIDALYPPQQAAVEAGVTDGANLVAAVPTASGKTLIAELAMLSQVDRGGKALYIVPLRALASEKHDEFGRWEEQGVRIGVSTGNYESTEGWLGARDIIVATSEKVDSLLRNGASWVEEISCVVIDEVHLIDDVSRGPTLEVTVAKLRRLIPDLQVVALSATVGNADVMAEWLDARLIESTWRPIDLRMGVHYGNAITFADGSQREVPVDAGERPTAALVADTLAGDSADDQGSTLVFVNSRRNAEAAAERLTAVTGSVLTAAEQAELRAVAEEARAASDTDTAATVAACIEAGAAFHHAGLTSTHRRLIEDAFRARLIKAVAATPTLAAGVNTPSRRVIVRDWQRFDATAGAMAPLAVLEVHQMMGRAGRPGRDPYGEAVLLAKDRSGFDELTERYIEAEPEPVDSKLAVEPALRTHVLATIATGFARDRPALMAFFDQTLYATQTADVRQLPLVVDRVLEYLATNDFIEREGEQLTATAMGHTVSRLYLDPMSAAEIIDGLRYAASPPAATDTEAAGTFQPASALHTETAEADPVAVTPLGVYHLIARTPDMYRLYLRSGDARRYGEICYEREPELLGRTPSEFEEVRFEEWLSALKTARMLEDWADEVDEHRIAERYAVGPGDIRGKVDTAVWLLGAAEAIAAELDLPAAPIIEARRRVEDGVRAELLGLVSIRQVGRKRARALFDAGICDREDLRTKPKAQILRALDGRRRTTERILENAGREDPTLEELEVSGVRTDAATDDDDEGPSDQARLGEF